MYVSLPEAVQLLKEEMVVALPTETVYGLAASIKSDAALEKIYQLKRRPRQNPLIIHISNLSHLKQCTDVVHDYVYDLINKFWPGPLTMVFKKSSSISGVVSNNLDTVALRMPNHPIFTKVIEEVGSPLAAPSANPYTQISPTQSIHVCNYFGDDLAVLEGGKCEIGIESTIIDVTQKMSINILRPGLITALEISSIAGVECFSTPSKLKVPGTDKKHYSPKTKTYYFDAVSANYLMEYTSNLNSIVLSIDNKFNVDNVIQLPNFPAKYAQVFYETLISCDAQSYDAIFIELPPSTAQWSGIVDKIKRAGSPLTEM